MIRFLFIRIVLLALVVPGAACTAGTGDPRSEQIGALVERAFEGGIPGGVVLVAQKDQVLYQSAIGVSTAGGRPLSSDSIFRIASVTKQFTAVAILQLAERGMLSLDDHINMYVPEFDTRGDFISIEMLLNHTSGIRSYTSMPGFDEELEATDVSPEQILEFFNNQDLLFKPGTLHSYSNSGYAMLGLIIERVSEQTYAEYMRDHIFDKAGMQRAFAGGSHGDTTGFATGHHRTGSGYQPTGYVSLTWPYAAGCIETTAADLHRWMRALFAGKLVGPQTLERAHAVTVLPNGRTIRYGYGWDVIEVQGHPSVEHGGGIAGFSSYLLYLPDDEVFVAVLCNTQRRGLADLSARLAAIAIGEPYSNSGIDIDPAALEHYAGTYADHNGDERVIQVKAGRLHSQRVGGMGLYLIPKAADVFKMDGQLIQIQFERDEAGRVIALIFKTRTRDTRWVRQPEPEPEPEHGTNP